MCKSHKSFYAPTVKEKYTKKDEMGAIPFTIVEKIDKEVKEFTMRSLRY